MAAGKAHDVAVIGAGVFGAWTAYELRRAGNTVVLLDAYGPGDSRASSGGDSRIIRMGYGPDELYARWAIRAFELWQQFFARVPQPLFCRTGVLWMAREGDAYVLHTLKTLEKLRVQFVKFSRPDLEKNFPQINFGSVSWGMLEPGSGALMARRAVQAVVEEGVREGVEYLNGAVVPPAGTGKLAALKTRDGNTIRAGQFVFACGPWLPALFPELLGDRIRPSRQEVFFYGVPAGDGRFSAPALPIWVDFGDLVYGFPNLEGRGMKLAIDRHGPAFNPESGERLPTPEGMAEARQHLERVFPAMKGAPLVEARVCQYENTSNGDFLIDRHPAYENVWIAGGGSGHGFKHGPVVGEYVTALVMGRGNAEPRFALATKGTVEKRAVY